LNKSNIGTLDFKDFDVSQIVFTEKKKMYENCRRQMYFAISVIKNIGPFISKNLKKKNANKFLIKIII